MVDTSTLAGVMAASRGSSQPQPTPAPARNIFGQPINQNRNANVGKALVGTALGLFDVPVQMIGGMHRDVIAGNQLGGQSAGSRALSSYGNQVRDLWSDVFRGNPSQTDVFLPREFDAASEAAIDRFGLEGGAATAARGAGVVADLLTGLATGGAGGLVKQGARVAADDVANFAKRIPGTFQPETAYYSSLLRRIMDDPDTALTTVRSMDSAEDIIGGSGVFRSSRDLGTSGSQSGGQAPELYNRLRDFFETNLGTGSDTAYGAFTSPVLLNQPAPLPLGARGRENFLNYQRIAAMFDPYSTARSYGAGAERTPLRYILDNDVLNRIGVSFGDSLRGAPAFNSYDDFVAALNNGGYNEIMSTPGKADWNWMKLRSNQLNIPEYLEAQIPNLSIDDVTGIVGLGNRPLDAGENAMRIADLVEASGRDIPVSAMSNVVPREVVGGTTKKNEIIENLQANPLYENIVDSLRNQRNRFVPPEMTDIISRFSSGGSPGGAYSQPSWGVGHMLRRAGEDVGNRNYSAVTQGLEDFYRQQINPRLQSFHRFLFPEVAVPPPPQTFFGITRNPSPFS